MRALEVVPNGENATVEELGVAMEAAPTKRSYLRLAAVRALLLGVARGAGLPAVRPQRPVGAAVD
jgi:hypothetical protein